MKNKLETINDVWFILGICAVLFAVTGVLNFGSGFVESHIESMAHVVNRLNQ